MEKMHSYALAVCLLASVLMAPAMAYNEPQVNLGYTSFMDGTRRPAPGSISPSTFRITRLMTRPTWACPVSTSTCG